MIPTTAVDHLASTNAQQEIGQDLMQNPIAPISPTTPSRGVVQNETDATHDACSPVSPGFPQASESVEESEADAKERLAKSRDRNREHARRTRLRKKQQLEALQTRVKELQDESKLLKQTIEECSIASILLGLSTGDTKNADEDMKGVESIISSAGKERTFFTVNGKRKRFVSDADCNPPPMKLRIKGKITLVGGHNSKTQINWKTGVYLDENGEQKQLTTEELEELRRERNRMHAKMTRDRKKLFISSVEKTIADLEQNNKLMRDILAKQALRHSTCVTPDLLPVNCSPDSVPPMTPELQRKNVDFDVDPAVA